MEKGEKGLGLGFEDREMGGLEEESGGVKRIR